MNTLHRCAALVACLLVAASAAYAQSQTPAKVAVYANGAVELNGRKVTPVELDESLRVHASRSGVVWYHRENPAAQPHPNADVVVQTIIKHRLPVSLSTKPDFSDYVDQNGVARPRR